MKILNIKRLFQKTPEQRLTELNEYNKIARAVKRVEREEINGLKK